MRKLTNLAATVFALSLTCVAVFAQSQGRPADDPCASACGVGGCAGCTAAPIFIVLVLVGIIILNVALLIWVAKDSKARGLDNSVLWMILVMFTGVLGLVIYIFSRPKGDIVQCPNCKNNRLQGSAK